MPFFASTVKPTSFVMMMFPGTADGQKPSVNASVSDSVAGSTSHDGALLSVVAGGVLATGAAVVSVETLVTGAAVFASTVIADEAKPAGELPDAVFATVVNVYAVPAVKPEMVQDPDAPVTVHFAPPGEAVTSYEVGAGPLVGGATVIVAFSAPATTVDTPGAFGTVLARIVLCVEAGLAAESPVLTFAIVLNVYAVPAVSPVTVHDPDAPVTVHVLPPGDAVTTYEVGVSPPAGAVTVMVACSSPATTVGVPGVFGAVFASAVVGAEADPAGELPDAVRATVVNVYAVPAVSPVTVHDPDAPVTVHVLPPGDAVTT